MLLLARVVVLSMVALAVGVQLGVWGATKIRTDSALLESWQPYFGWPYAVAFAIGQLAVCWWLLIERGPTWLARTWAAVGAGVAALSLAGRGFDLDEAAALTSGFGAVVLAAGLWDGRLVPRRR